MSDTGARIVACLNQPIMRHLGGDYAKISEILAGILQSEQKIAALKLEITNFIFLIMSHKGTDLTRVWTRCGAFEK